MPHCDFLEESNSKGKKYLSPAAATALATEGSCNSPLDMDIPQSRSFERGSSSASEDEHENVPKVVLASPHSSAPSSPKGNVVDMGDEGFAGHYLTATMTEESAGFKKKEPKKSGISAIGDTTALTGELTNITTLCIGSSVEKARDSKRRSDDPYADVRERMERLSLYNKMHHAYHKRTPRDPSGCSSHHEITVFAAITTYLGYVVLIITGHIRDICANLFRRGRYLRANMKHEYACTVNCGSSLDTYPSDDFTKYAPLLKSWENFYTRRLYHRIQDCFNRPITSRPSGNISVLERISFDGNKTMSVLGQLSNLHDEEKKSSYSSGDHFDQTLDGRVVRRCLNLGSYNYLGFADDWDITCRNKVIPSLDALPSSVGSCRLEFGTTNLHCRVEEIVATFVGKEDAVVLNMGFNTNATIIPALTSRGDLIVSDELNHTSIVNGARASGAAIRTFRHNDSSDLELILREAIVYGQPRTRRPWNRILVIVEGIYSMEGEYCDLRNIVAVCKKYGAYVYLDEAHSIGAMGPTGRGCCEYTGVNPRDVDIMMGTFTKSFGGMGGYVASNKEVIELLRRECSGSSYHNSISPAVCQQIISSFQVIMGEDGTNIGIQKLNALRDNSNYFRMQLIDMGFHVLGHYDSPVIPVMLYNPTKIAAFSRECLKRGLAVVVVGFPAVPILMSRARFCISAGHSRRELDRALKELNEIADLLKLRYARSTFG